MAGPDLHGNRAGQNMAEAPHLLIVFQLSRRSDDFQARDVLLGPMFVFLSQNV